MQFLKFPSIEYYDLYIRNKDNSVSLNQYISDNPGLAWVITEKIDGCNFGLCVTKDDFEIQKRNSLIENNNQDLWGLYKGKDRFIEIVEHIREKLNQFPNIKQMIFYGEWFGKGIMKRIYYGESHYYRFFGISAITNDDKVINYPFETLYIWMTEWNQLDHLVTVLGIDTDLKRAVQYKNDFISHLTPSDSITEGIVISPWNKSTFIRFKSKNDKFKESTNNEEEWKKEFDNDDVYKLHIQFKNLCSESRMFGIFSKLGIPANGNKDASNYIKAFQQDALEDLIRIYPEYNDFEYSQKRKVTSIGKIPYNLFITVWNKLISND